MNSLITEILEANQQMARVGMINLNELSAFLAAVEHGSFSEAGRQLGLSQPAVSQKIEHLEKYLGTRLFQREGRSLRLTEAGMVLRPIAQQLVASSIRLEESMASLQGALVGEITIGCSAAAGKYLLPRMIACFRKTSPQVRINIHEFNQQIVESRLVSGEASLGICNKQPIHKYLESKEIFEEDVVLIVPAQHPWARFGYIEPFDLPSEPLLIGDEAEDPHEAWVALLAEYGITPGELKIAMQIDNPEARVIAVAEGVGAAFVSRLAALRELDKGSVVEVHVDGLSLNRKLYLVRNTRILPSPAQAEFWDFIHAIQPIQMFVQG